MTNRFTRIKKFELDSLGREVALRDGVSGKPVDLTGIDILFSMRDNNGHYIDQTDERVVISRDDKSGKFWIALQAGATDGWTAPYWGEVAIRRDYWRLTLLQALIEVRGNLREG